MKTIITDCSVVDILVVGRALPQDELDQIKALTGAEFNYEETAVQLMSNAAVKWCIREAETKEPLAVGGLLQIGPTIWRTWFFANQRAWNEYGRELTVHVARTRKNILDTQDHARIETVALASREDACRWYEAVGMTHESTMRGYGVNGESAVMYVSTKGASD